MGIDKIVCFLLFVFLSKSISSQNSNDTIFINNDYYVKHIVKINESLSDIANYYNITVNKILETNETNLQLYYKQVLYIPIKISKKKPLFNLLKKYKTIDIALLLPFYKNLNDTLVASFEEEEDAEKVILSKSAMALDFMQGVHLALDSLERLGMNINLIVLDTQNDSAKTAEIIKYKILDTVEVILGPIYSRNMQLVSDRYGNDKKKLIISPLSKSSEFLKDNTSSLQINTPFKIQSKIISRFIEEKYKSFNVIICYVQKEKGLAKYIERSLSKKLKNITKM
jgi:LysM repeat protein